MRKYLAALAAFVATAVTICAQSSFYTISGQDILDPGGSPFLMRGSAISGWRTPEAYLLGLNRVHDRHIGSASDIETRIRDLLGNDQDAEAFWNAFNANLVTAQDIADLAADGYNTVRIPFNYRTFSPEATPGVYSTEGFQALDQLILWCKNNGLAVILDMHAAPGGQSHDTPADPEHTYWEFDGGINDWVEVGVACLWEFNQDYFNATGRDPAFNKQRTADIWREIADRYKNETAILGYELINETVLPFGVNSSELRDLMIQITTAIRQVDQNHIIFVEGNYYASSLDGLTPPWDSKQALMFHFYWKAPVLSEIQDYINTAASHNLPLLMSEAGENSNAWLYKTVQLLEGNNIGWCVWGDKKVDSIITTYSAEITPDYQYVIDNFRDTPVDPAIVKSGLMDLANNIASGNAIYHPGFAASVLDPLYGISPQAYINHTIPGTIHAVNYDIGTDGVAYSDTVSMNSGSGDTWNNGWAYRNDGVDIVGSSDGANPQDIGFNIAYSDANEWLKYTVNVQQTANYQIKLRVATPGGQVQLLLNGVDLTGTVNVDSTGGWGNWASQTLSQAVSLTAGQHVLELKHLSGGVDVSWVEFTLLNGPAKDYANTDIVGSGTVSGSYVNTQASDNDYEAITEVQSGGRPADRHSLLEHKWTVDVLGGDSVIFYVEAHKTANSEGDDFVFAYSTDNVNFTDMVTVTKTADDNATQSYSLPSSLSGTVYIRVMDTDRTQGQKVLDTVYIDEMYITSDGTPPPNQAPSFSSDPVVEANATEDSAYSASIADAASDPEGDPMTFSKVSGPVWLSVAANGALSGTPGAADVGLNSFTVQVDATGGSDTATLQITVDAAGTITDIYISDIAMSSATYGGNRISGIATITVRDESGATVSGATVSADWSGATSSSTSGSTDGSGIVVFESDKKKNGGTYTVTVTDVTASGYNYNSALNVETSDSITAP